MTSSILAALLLIAAALYVFFSAKRLATAALVIAFITLGYISGNNDTTFGSGVSGVISGITVSIDWISKAF
jgi:hypothetical protein